jgi:hypothetical protein
MTGGGVDMSMRQVLRALVALVAGLASATVGQAQRGAAPPVKQHAFELEKSYVRYPLPAGESTYGRIDGDRMKGHVDAITAIARKDRDSGSKYWGRLPGTASDKETEQLVASLFRSWGLQDVHLQTFDLPPQWFATDWSFSVTGSGTTLTPKTAFPTQRSAQTPGMELEVVWVGLGTELDFAGRDVRGKLAFVHAVPWPNGVQHSARFNGALERAVEHGAAAVLVNVAIPGNITQSIAGAPKVPTFAIGSDDAAELKALMEKAPVKASLRIAAEQRSGLTDANVWGTVPGTSSEEILVIAHHDGRFESAFDNASGVATMLGLAEYFASLPQAQRRRTLKFVSTGAHLSGAAGTELIHANRDTLLANTVLILNCEHTSVTNMNQFGPAEGVRWPEQGRLRKTTAVNARQWWVNGSDRLASRVLQAFRTFGVAVWDDEMYDGGNMGAIARDTASVQTIVSPVYYGSDFDRSDVVPASGLEAVARAYAKIIDEVNTMTRDELGGAAADPTARR